MQKAGLCRELAFWLGSGAGFEPATSVMSHTAVIYLRSDVYLDADCYCCQRRAFSRVPVRDAGLGRLYYTDYYHPWAAA